MARAAKDYLKRKRPDIQSRSATTCTRWPRSRTSRRTLRRSSASGADTVITGNWGSDLALLIQRIGKDAGLTTNFYTYYGATNRCADRHGRRPEAGPRQVRRLLQRRTMARLQDGGDVIEGFKKKYNDDFYVMADAYTGIAMLGKAFTDQPSSTDPVKVAKALEGMKADSLNGTVEMRRFDHQAQQSLVRGYLDQGRRQGDQVRPGKHRLWLEDRCADGPVCGGAADFLPDEAPGLSQRLAGSAARSGAPARSCILRSARGDACRPGG
ncbi:ABC transporter substrate-binding protein [Cupriavidus basilensis]